MYFQKKTFNSVIYICSVRPQNKKQRLNNTDTVRYMEKRYPVTQVCLIKNQSVLKIHIHTYHDPIRV